MSVLLKRILYLDLFTLLMTGLAYGVPAYLDRWFFFDIERPLPGLLLMSVHGAGAMVFLYLFGYLTRSHVQVRMTRVRHLKSGLVMLGTLALLVISGFSLYYIGGERLRLWSGDIHCLIGIFLPFTLLLHRYDGAIGGFFRRWSPHSDIG